MKRRNSDTSKGIENFGTRHASKGMEALSGSLGSYIEFLSEGSAREAPTLLGSGAEPIEVHGCTDVHPIIWTKIF